MSSGVQVGCIHSFVATGSDMSSRVKRLHTKIHKPIRKKSLSFLNTIFFSHTFTSNDLHTHFQAYIT